MAGREQQIQQIEERNSDLAKEILLNESAVYETEKEIEEIDEDIWIIRLSSTMCKALKYLLKESPKRMNFIKLRFSRTN